MVLENFHKVDFYRVSSENNLILINDQYEMNYLVNLAAEVDLKDDLEFQTQNSVDLYVKMMMLQSGHYLAYLNGMLLFVYMSQIFT